MPDTTYLDSRKSCFRHIVTAAIFGAVFYGSLSYLETGAVEIGPFVGCTMSFGFLGFFFWLFRLTRHYHQAPPSVSQDPFGPPAPPASFKERLQEYVSRHPATTKQTAEKSRMPFWCIDLSGQGLAPRAAEYFRQLLIHISKLVGR